MKAKSDEKRANAQFQEAESAAKCMGAKARLNSIEEEIKQEQLIEAKSRSAIAVIALKEATMQRDGG